MLSNLQNVNYVQWAPLLCMLARTEAHDVSAIAGAVKSLKYALNTNRTIVEPTLCNIWRHMDAVYNWEPSMYEALASIAARFAQLMNDYSPGSDSKVV